MQSLNTYQAAEAYLPHKPPMVLLEKVIEVTPTEVTCQVRINAESVVAPFLNAAGGLPSWYVFEMMAQTIGVWSGWHAQEQGEQPQLGMLLGMRSFTVEVPIFKNETVLELHAVQLLRDDRLGSFACVARAINSADKNAPKKVLAEGRLNVYQPSPTELKQLFKIDSAP